MRLTRPPRRGIMGAGGLTRLRSFDALLTQAPVAWMCSQAHTKSTLAFARTCSDYRLALTAIRLLVLLAAARLSYSHPLAPPRTSVLRYTSCGCVYRAAQGSRTRGRYRSLLLAFARTCSDYRLALTAIRLLVYGSRKPDSANDSIAPTITNAPVSAQATTPTEDSLCKGE